MHGCVLYIINNRRDDQLMFAKFMQKYCLPKKLRNIISPHLNGRSMNCTKLSIANVSIAQLKNYGCS